MDAVKVKNLSNDIFDKVNFTVERGSFTTITGRCGCGKSTLFNILTESKSVKVFGKSIRYMIDKGYVGIVSGEFNSSKCVIDEFVDLLKAKGRAFDKIKDDVQRVASKTGIDYILDKKVCNLSIKEKILFQFTMQILNRPKVLILDNAFGYLDFEKSGIVREVKRLNKKCTIINITNDSREIIYGTDVIVMDDEFNKYKVSDLIEDDYISFGLEVPFMVCLCSKLNFYGVIDDNYFDMERLVDSLWQ